VDDAQLQRVIESAWEARAEISSATTGEVRDAIEASLDALDSGRLRVAERRDNDWHTHQWLKMAVLLSFRLYDMAVIPGGPVGPGRGEAACRPLIGPLSMRCACRHTI